MIFSCVFGVNMQGIALKVSINGRIHRCVDMNCRHRTDGGCCLCKSEKNENVSGRSECIIREHRKKCSHGNNNVWIDIHFKILNDKMD